jgi:hypothetical protein
MISNSIAFIWMIELNERVRRKLKETKKKIMLNTAKRDKTLAPSPTPRQVTLVS